MAAVQKKENLTIAIREYQDNQGQTKKVWKTIGEIITWDDGKQSFELWGAGGFVKGSVFEQDSNNQQQSQQQAPQQQAPQQNYQQQPQGGFNQQAPQQNGFNQQNNYQQNNG